MTIKTSELRVGNLINRITLESKYTPASDWGLIEEVRVSTGVIYIIEDPVELWEFEPIPLTEDWLAKCAGIEVEEDSKLVWWKDSGGEIFIFCEMYAGGFYVPKNNFGIRRKLSFVHEAQNYFYESTGQELTLIK